MRHQALCGDVLELDITLDDCAMVFDTIGHRDDNETIPLTPGEEGYTSLGCIDNKCQAAVYYVSVAPSLLIVT